MSCSHGDLGFIDSFESLKCKILLITYWLKLMWAITLMHNYKNQTWWATNCHSLPESLSIAHREQQWQPMTPLVIPVTAVFSQGNLPLLSLQRAVAVTLLRALYRHHVLAFPYSNASLLHRREYPRAEIRPWGSQPNSKYIGLGVVVWF